MVIDAEGMEKYYINNIEGKVTLGVQVRLTDMKHYHNVSGIEKYINKKGMVLYLAQIVYLCAENSVCISTFSV